MLNKLVHYFIDIDLTDTNIFGIYIKIMNKCYNQDHQASHWCAIWWIYYDKHAKIEFDDMHKFIFSCKNN